MKYLKCFETEAEYASYKNGSDYITPNISYVEEMNGIYYNPGSGSSSSYVMVDLGLPSGLLWADRNIGAVNPEDNGLYFAWGDTTGYTVEQVSNGEKKFASDFSDYFDTTDGGSTFNKYETNKLTVLQPEDDAATVNMGSDWRMPTRTDFDELINNTTHIYVDLNGNEFSKLEAESGSIAAFNFKGIKFIGSNGNSIFIPTSGYCYDSVFEGAYFAGSMWSSSLHVSGSMDSYAIIINFIYSLSTLYMSRCTGRVIRGVCSK